jgi:hypothetical protein
MAEVLPQTQAPEHFELHYEDNGEATICMTHGGACALLVEVMDGYTPEEEQQLIDSTVRALEAIDRLTQDKTGEIFRDLHIKIGEDLAWGGARALAEENQVVLNGRKMLLSIAEMRTVSGAYDKSELQNDSIEEDRPGGALEYTLVHEMAHILDGRTVSGNPYHRIAASESPTKYGREPDEGHSENKGHEAFAEGFAHMVYGIAVSPAMETVIQETLEMRLNEVASSS